MPLRLHQTIFASIASSNRFKVEVGILQQEHFLANISVLLAPAQTTSPYETRDFNCLHLDCHIHVNFAVSLVDVIHDP